MANGLTVPEDASGWEEGPAGYSVRPLFDAGVPRPPPVRGLGRGGVEIAPAERRGQGCTVGFMAVWSLVWNGIVGVLLAMAIAAWVRGGPNAPPLWFMAIFVAVGLGVAAATLKMAFVRRSWVVGRGWIGRRSSIPALGRTSDRLYQDLERLEIR